MAAGWLSRLQVAENATVQDFPTATIPLPLDVEVTVQGTPQEEGSASSSSAQEDLFERNKLPFLGFHSIPKEYARPLIFLEVKKIGTAWSERASSELERMGSGMSTISGSGGSGADSDGGEGKRVSTLPEPGKLPSSQFKGVVPQPNGRWGAQIYEKHQRLWLGTFNEEVDAAKAYDRAALKFRGRDAMTNFSPAGDGDPEAVFLSMHTKEQIVDMLRRHTYEEELEQSRRPVKRQVSTQETMEMDKGMRDDSKEAVAVVAGGRAGAVAAAAAAGGSSYSAACSLPRDHLFEKALTPSDVGKLNRLVIPKQHAERCFPLDANSNEKGLFLNFEDPSRRVWRFRYSYWNSSQSYVLTKGWSRFVKEKKLSAGDVVSFDRGVNEQLFISCRRRPPQCSTLQRPNQQRRSDQQVMMSASARAQLVAAASLQGRNLVPSSFLNPWLQTTEKFNQTGSYRLSDPDAVVQQCRTQLSTISAAHSVLSPQEVLQSESVAWRSYGRANFLTSAAGCGRGAPCTDYQVPDFSIDLYGTSGSIHSDAGIVSSDRDSIVDVKIFDSCVGNIESTERDFAAVQEVSQSSTSGEELGSLLQPKREMCGQGPSTSPCRKVASNAMKEVTEGSKRGLRLFGVDLVPLVESQKVVIGCSLTLGMRSDDDGWALQRDKSDDCVYNSKTGRANEARSKRKMDVQDAESSAGSCPRRFKSPSI